MVTVWRTCCYDRRCRSTMGLQPVDTEAAKEVFVDPVAKKGDFSAHLAFPFAEVPKRASAIASYRLL
jgi:hypothetical protein